MGQYQVKIVRTEEGLKALSEHWIQLHKMVLPQIPFLSYEWSINYWQHLCPPSTPFLLTAWSEDTLVGLLALRLENKWGFRLLRFLGDGRSDYLGFLVAPNHLDVFSVLTESLYKQRYEWDCFFLRKLHENCSDPNLACVPDDFRAIQVKSGVAPYLSFPDGWTDLCAKGPSQIREAGRKLRKFQRDGGTVERIAGHDYLLLAEQIKNIEANSWKKRGDTAKFQTTEEQKMLEQLLKTFLPRDKIEVWLAHIHSKPTAFLINFLTPERTCFYQTAYDENYQKYSPGTILFFLAMERTWRAGLREFDFMDGREPFKKRWANNERELKKLVVFRKTLRGHMAFAALVISRGYQKYLRTKIGGSSL